jgi:hypothetical protein
MAARRFQYPRERDSANKPGNRSQCEYHTEGENYSEIAALESARFRIFHDETQPFLNR